MPLRDSIRDEKAITLKPRWYFGGVASTVAAGIMHPLDLLKVHFQTNTGKLRTIRQVRKIIKEHGIRGIYHGVSASLVRQYTYATVRFATFDVGSNYFSTETLMDKLPLTILGGVLGAFVGCPSEKVTVRMQNDTKLPPEKRYNYKHVLDGLVKIYKTEGIRGTFEGLNLSCARSIGINIGQICFYSEMKNKLIQTGYLTDNVHTHILSSILTSTFSSLLVQPVDVIKSRVMSNTPRKFTGTFDAVKFTMREGPLTFFQGFVPAFWRRVPLTIIIFLLYEQLRLNFGLPS